MAKFDEGDTVRLTRNMEFGSTQIRKNTKGVIKSIRKKMVGKNEYSIRWKGVAFDVTMIGDKDIAPDGDLSW